jgi:hypothetical protein
MVSITQSRPLHLIDLGNRDEPIPVQTQVCATLMKVAHIASSCDKLCPTERNQTEIKNLNKKTFFIHKRCSKNYLACRWKTKPGPPSNKTVFSFLISGVSETCERPFE